MVTVVTKGTNVHCYGYAKKPDVSRSAKMV